MLISSIQFITFIFYWHFVEFVWIVILLHFYY
jgi:heme/copper-type cytochrome/quinol oxidase subunit 3